MLQFGIVSKNKIPTAKFDPRRPPPIALTLLDEFPSPLSDEDEQRLSLIYRSLHGVENSRMITFPGRFRAIDDAIESEIGKAFQPGRPIHVHEMAASNAITSLDLFERLRGRFGNAGSVSASDYADSVYVVSVSGWHVVFDVEKRPLQFIGRHFVISTVKERKRHPVNRLIR